MQIVIPMSGFGERFRLAGYSVPKPLIEIEGKPLIAHVIDMFPGEKDFIFICNQDHLANPDFCMKKIIKKYCPTGRIVGIGAHKLGPIHAIRQIEHLLKPNKPVLVNYCDFTCYWDWQHFKWFVRESFCAGVIPAYRGFHPHSLGNTNYAYIRESMGWVADIKEKQPFTSNRIEEYASSGSYYFASAQLMSQAFLETIKQNLNVNGEYYVSLSYKALLANNQPVAVYPLQHFMQWGTPEDVAEYNYWSKVFKQLIELVNSEIRPKGTLIMPMAGFGKRFANEGYALSKPLIPVSGMPMVVQATRDLPPAEELVFVLRADMQGNEEVAQELTRLYPRTLIKTIDHVTDGQACTALIGLDALADSLGDILPIPLTIGACDNGVLYDRIALESMLADTNVDVIVWGVRAYPNALRHPNMYGWIKEENGLITGISVKKPLDSPASDPIVLGTFTFQRIEDFRRAIARLIDRDGRINGEFYIDSCINEAIELGLKCYLFEVDSYLCWGTPNDLLTFEYWQSCFHKWNGHPYRLEDDFRINSIALNLLKDRYLATVPTLMKTEKKLK